MNMDKPPQIAFILGPPKCGTSSLVGMLNIHPKILGLFETEMYKPRPTKYGRQLLEGYPSWRRLFGEYENISKNYEMLAEEIPDFEHEYNIIIDKVPTISGKKTYRLAKSVPKVIFIYRNIEDWLVKNLVKKWYHIDNNVVPAACDYTINLINTYKIKSDKICRVKLKNFIAKNSDVPFRVSSFLGVDHDERMNRWWDHLVVAHERNPITRYQRWHEGRNSSKKAPEGKDTEVQLTNHPFWDFILPLFKKYSQENKNDFEQKEINSDINKLRKAKNKHEAGYEDLYTHKKEKNVKINAKKLNFLGKALYKISVELKSLSERFG